MRLITAALLLMSGCLTACNGHHSENADVDMTVADVGKQMVADHCISCHSETSDPGPNPDAPPLAEVFADLDPEALFDDFRTGNHIGGEEMPAFDFSVQEADAIVTYLEELYQAQLD